MSAAPSEPGGRVATACQRGLGVLVLLVLAYVILGPGASPGSDHPFALVVMIALLVLIYVLAADPVATWFRAHEWTRRSWNGLVAGVCVLGTAVAGLVAYSTAYVTTWDARLIELATRVPSDTVPYVVPGSILSPAAYGAYLRHYFSRYPNNNTMASIGRLAHWIASWTGLDYEGVVGALNVLSLLAAALTVYVLVARLRGRGWGLVALVLVWTFLGLSPWLGVPYTDTLSMWGPIASLAVFLLARDAAGGKRWALLMASALLVAVATLVKSTIVAGLPALVIVILLAPHDWALPHGWVLARRWRPARWSRLGSVVASALVIATYAVVVLAGNAAAHWTADLPPKTPGVSATTPSVYVAMGFREQVFPSPFGPMRYYGGYDRGIDYAAYRNPGTQEQNRVARAAIAQEWEERGLIDTIGFEIAKAGHTFGDGVFFYRGEGTDALQPPLHDNALGRFAYDLAAPAGGDHAGWAFVVQAGWMVLLLGLAIGLLRAPARVETLLLALTVLGIGAFLLLFLARSRYLIPHLPVIIALTVLVLPTSGGGRAGSDSSGRARRAPAWVPASWAALAARHDLRRVLATAWGRGHRRPEGDVVDDALHEGGEDSASRQDDWFSFTER